MDYRPPLEGTRILALLRAGSSTGEGCYIALRIHPPLSAQTAQQIKYRYSLEVRDAPWDGNTPRLFVTAEFDRTNPRRGGKDAAFFLGVFDRYGHRNLGRSEDWGDLVLFTRKALSLACEECALERDGLTPARQLRLAGGRLEPVDDLVVELTLDLLAALAARSGPEQT